MTSFSEYAVGSSKLINSSSETINILGAITNSIKTIDSETEYIFEGNKFWAGTTVDVGISASNTIYILGIVSAPCTLMGARSIQATSSAAISVTVELYENVATVTNSANITSFCMNRNITSIGTFTFNNSPAAITAAGTLLPPTNIIKSTATIAYNSPISYNYEMKNNTKYALKITNNGAATATLTFLWTWSEI